MLLEITSLALLIHPGRPNGPEGASSVSRCTLRVHSAHFRFSLAGNRGMVIMSALPAIAPSKKRAGA